MTAVNVPLVPLLSVTLLASKPVTASLKVNVRVTSPLAVAATLSVRVTVGAVVSISGKAVLSMFGIRPPLAL